MTLQAKLDAFLAGKRFAVVGASQDRTKYGNKVLRTYLQNKLTVFPVNPRADQIEGLPSHPDLTSVPAPIDGISVITPPGVTEQVVEEAVQLGIRHLWIQPGAESQRAVALAKSAGMVVISGGPCILVVLEYREAET
ncbi:MAG: CoA-binding protein [Planctomycetaceae bacterium]|nr:CoA-binding protein [Planctomycetaceae bacterium]